MTALVDWDSGRLAVATDAPVPDLSVIYSPQIDGFHSGAFDSGHVETRPDQLPRPELRQWADGKAAEFSCFQYFPAIGPSASNPKPPRSEMDRNFALHGRVVGAWSTNQIDSSKSLIFTAKDSRALRLDVAVATPRDILLERLEAQASAGKEPASWITIPQTHIYTADELDTMAFAGQKLADASKTLSKSWSATPKPVGGNSGQLCPEYSTKILTHLVSQSIFPGVLCAKA